MSNWLKQLHYELHRFRKVYAALLVLVAVMQVAGLLLYTHNYMNGPYGKMAVPPLRTQPQEDLPDFQLAGFFDYASGSLWFTGAIMLCAAAVFFYIFLIWYRDWFGRNMFIYRLLMLPERRGALYAAKLVTVFLLVGGLVAFQLVLLPAEKALFNSQIPADHRWDISIVHFVHGNHLLHLLIPDTFGNFLFSYAIGLIFVILAFNGILLERSYRLKGAIGGVLLIGIAAAILLFPLYWIETRMPDYLYPRERFAMELIDAILVTGLSLWFSLKLLNKKVTV